MTSTDLDRYWKASFGDTLPIADQLKWRFKDRWFRIHTLPNSKRYPDDQVEYDEILGRHNAIVTDLIGTGNQYFLLASGASSGGVPYRNAKTKRLGLQTNLWKTIKVDEADDSDPIYCHVYFDQGIWQPGSKDSLFRLVADEIVWGVMLFAIQDKALYSPYDGGADVILPNTKHTEFYKEKYKDWLSDHPSGL